MNTEPTSTEPAKQTLHVPQLDPIITPKLFPDQMAHAKASYEAALLVEAGLAEKEKRKPKVITFRAFLRDTYKPATPFRAYFLDYNPRTPTVAKNGKTHCNKDVTETWKTKPGVLRRRDDLIIGWGGKKGPNLRESNLDDNWNCWAENLCFNRKFSLEKLDAILHAFDTAERAGISTNDIEDFSLAYSTALVGKDGKRSPLPNTKPVDYVKRAIVEEWKGTKST